MSGIGQKRYVPEHPAEVHKAENGQCEQRKLALAAVAKDWYYQDCGDHKDWQSQEQTVPPRFAVGRIAHPADDARGDDSKVNSSGDDPIVV